MEMEAEKAVQQLTNIKHIQLEIKDAYKIQLINVNKETSSGHKITGKNRSYISGNAEAL